MRERSDSTGAVADGVAGRDIEERVSSTVEDEYWRENFATRPYVCADLDYKWYQPAYRYGWESRAALKNAKWDDVESKLDAEWMMRRGESMLEWDDARPAALDAWNRVGGEIK